LQVAEVIAVQILMDRWGAEARGAFSIVGRLLDLIPTVFGNASVESRPVQALRTYEQMVAVVRGTDNPVILYLVSQIGCPLAYELATKGFGLEAANLLTSTVHPLFEVVWGGKSLHTQRVAREGHWLLGVDDNKSASEFPFVRLALDLGALTGGRSWKSHYRYRIRAVRDVSEASAAYADKIIDSPLSARRNLIKPAIAAFEEAIRGLEALAERTIDESEARFALALALAALACLYNVQPNSGDATTESVIKPLLRSQDLLYDVRVKRSEELKDLTRVLLAEGFNRRKEGDPEENVNEVLVHTDSVDLTKRKYPYHWALTKLLRGIAYRKRQETKDFSGGIPDDFQLMLDFTATSHFFKEASGIFEEDKYPLEHATLLLENALAGVTVASSAPDDVKENFILQLLKAEEIITPVSHPSE
jgi:hypothetical protein